MDATVERPILYRTDFGIRTKRNLTNRRATGKNVTADNFNGLWNSDLRITPEISDNQDTFAIDEKAANHPIERVVAVDFNSAQSTAAKAPSENLLQRGRKAKQL
jgi:hypothetical protein